MSFITEMSYSKCCKKTPGEKSNLNTFARGIPKHENFKDIELK